MDEIFKHWSTSAEAAHDIGVAHVRVRQWRSRRSIPPAYFTAIVAAAERRGFPITLQQLAETRAKPVARS
jgi:hypothetical protein